MATSRDRDFESDVRRHTPGRHRDPSALDRFQNDRPDWEASLKTNRKRVADGHLQAAFRRAALEDAELRRLRASGKPYACLEFVGASGYEAQTAPDFVGAEEVTT